MDIKYYLDIIGNFLTNYKIPIISIVCIILTFIYVIYNQKKLYEDMKQ